MTEQTKSSISTIGGKFFDILRPQDYEFDINEIAHALSNLCRYTGHVSRFYSVAEHSVLVSRIVPEKYALEALLHDASEAYLGDVSSPLKRLLPDYREIENNVQQAIADFYGLNYPFHEEIHKADKRMYWAERKSVAPGPKDTLWHQDLAATRKVEAVGINPLHAKRMFLFRYKEIKDGKEIKRNELLTRQRAT